MHCIISLRALAAQSLLLFLSRSRIVTARDSTTTTIVTSTRTSTLSTITTTITASETAAVASPTATTGSMAYTGDAFSAAILNSTNYYRAQHQAAGLTWDKTLAEYSQAYANDCIWEHSGGPYGENLAEGYATPGAAIDAWAGEEKKYNYKAAKFSESTGHYTQLVWMNTTMVGCGAKQCSSSASNGVKGWYVVCEYTPRGNVAGQFREEVRKPGEGKDGKPGLGGASRTGTGGRWLGALVAVSVLLAAVCA